MIQVLLHPEVADCKTGGRFLMLRLIFVAPPGERPASFPTAAS